MTFLLNWNEPASSHNLLSFWITIGAILGVTLSIVCYLTANKLKQRNEQNRTRKGLIQRLSVSQGMELQEHDSSDKVKSEVKETLKLFFDNH